RRSNPLMRCGQFSGAGVPPAGPGRKLSLGRPARSSMMAMVREAAGEMGDHETTEVGWRPPLGDVLAVSDVRLRFRPVTAHIAGPEAGNLDDRRRGRQLYPSCDPGQP